MRKCVFHGCTESVGFVTALCCRKHWRSLNQKEKDLLVDAHAEHRDGHIITEELIHRQQNVIGTRGTV